MAYELFIEKDIPLAGKRRNNFGIMGLMRQMELGDSLFVPEITRGSQLNVWALRPKRFITRKDTRDGVDGIRVWRVEDFGE